jgi:hypothetical protein
LITLAHFSVSSTSGKAPHGSLNKPPNPNRSESRFRPASRGASKIERLAEPQSLSYAARSRCGPTNPPTKLEPAVEH